MSRCIGCGVKLQNDDINKVGYTNDLKNKYCARCFKMIHYNIETKLDNVDNFKVINKINKLGYYTIFITDLLNLNNNLINLYKKINNNKILVINKCDIIPNNLKLEHLEENIKKVYKIDNVFFISAKKDLYLNRIIGIIEREGKVIICGETSSGKSTLINELINTKLTTSKYNNTTMDFIKLKYNDYIIYDTPGFIINNKNNIDNIVVYTKKLSNEYVLIIDDIRLKGEGNITCFLDSNIKISSKKDNNNLEYKYEFKSNKDIELINGFIFIKGNVVVYSNKELTFRDSIIK